GEAMLMGDQLVPRSFVNEGPVQRLRGLRGHDLEAVLEPIPSSPLVMQAMMQVAPNVASVAQLNAFLSRHDPAGYWTACLFAIALYTEEESNLVRSRLTAEQREAAGSPPPTGRYSPVLFTAAHAFEPQRTITASSASILICAHRRGLGISFLAPCDEVALKRHWIALHRSCVSDLPLRLLP
ncbi:MAG TPA: hypothetical protein VLR71_12830, partial [Casimicrobiaceae bacterium]|nr:hypothetical protein [Casimicrobiaceae bacterium]